MTMVAIFFLMLFVRCKVIHRKPFPTTRCYDNSKIKTYCSQREGYIIAGAHV